ncbi:tRNA threonylcarbamoyladenosine biosynthesis protein TsaB [hydrothermal vent metagenome]|uniref:tRNA threonylcarbamoyladenosine biosynthesis protein TsaB n=1 Tax=hydrothermal vent metagenome TaxID=652676 RepID=A0A3B1AGZ3_9ZZZZ
MNILAIDTVTEMCSVALLSHKNIYSQERFVPQQHTQVILAMVQQLLAEAQLGLSNLDAISFSRGPGSFTGLRICASVTQGLALAHDLSVIPISSLAILAQGAVRLDKQASILACMDARKNEVYWACYQFEDNQLNLFGDEQVTAPADVKLENNLGWHGVGTGFVQFGDELNVNSLVNLNSVEAKRYPLAQDMLPLATQAWEMRNNSESKMVVDVSLALPKYLRDNVAIPQKARTTK